MRCVSCGEPVIPGAKFCLECGASLDGPPPPARGPAEPVAERRLVSVLFADMVGFTTLSEHRDPEEVRELLGRYFDRCRTLIERYGGTVEKFIGDAVMAVWGTPVAREDDAERAVRAALSLTQAVTLLAEEVGIPDLRVRAGVLTGHAAVELGVEVEGMVLGDTVNTASRLQSLAPPGTVLVDDVTRRASEAAIAYEDAGTHEVKGREQPVHAWTALRVVAGAGGARRAAGLEAPLVGRDTELAQVIESFEATASDGRARLVSVVGEAGAGKSRLVWEFYKYIDGIEKVVRWHQGRCLSYGEGVAYWALTEMVRARAGIVEEEDSDSSRAKLRATVEEHVPDERERRLVEPRLAHLLGLEQRTAPDRADLFSGWRLFLERMAERLPVVLVFEDLQWADSGLLDFIDYLLEWSAEFPIFMLALGRQELVAARPSWAPTITLGPLSEHAMTQLLGGLVPGLPEELAANIRRRSEGVPLYAVETVRMLLDRGLVAQDGPRYVVTGDIADLEVPETLHALVAARLDNLDPAERSLLQDAAVIGQSFTPATLIAVCERPAAEVQRLLDGLVAKQVLAFIDEPLSAERGQYVFLQGLLRTIALGTLSRRDRKARHLAVAQHLRDAWGEEAGDIAEVLASHYLDAVEADPEAQDAEAIRSSACQTLADAGRRALSLALGPEARRHFERAAELAGEPALRGRLLREAGTAARVSGELDPALELLTQSVEFLSDAGLAREAARAEGLASETLRDMGRIDEAWERASAAYGAVDDGSDDEAVADLADRTSRIEFMRGNLEEALRQADVALRIADGMRLGDVLVMAMITKANSLAELARPSESTALLRHAAKIAVEQDLAEEAGRAYFNLADNLMGEGRYAEADELLAQGLELARRRGDRTSEQRLLSQRLNSLLTLGRWEELVNSAQQLTKHSTVYSAQKLVAMPSVLAARADMPALLALESDMTSATGWASVDLGRRIGQAVIFREIGRSTEASAQACEAMVQLIHTGTAEVPPLFAESVECAFAAGEPERVAELLAEIDKLKPAELTPLLDAEATRARARLAVHRGELDQAEQWFKRSIGLFRELGTPFFLARAEIELAELLSTLPDRDELGSLRDEAEAVLEGLDAKPWLGRARSLVPTSAAAA